MSGPRLSLGYAHPAPVLSLDTPGAAGNRFGFEGGRVVKVEGTYHLFTSEMAGEPMWVRMRLGHWISPDRLRWTRAGTLRESSGDQGGRDPRAALWSPLPAWDPGRGEWNLFYVAYKSLPNTPEKFLSNFEGRIVREVAARKGPAGIAGPWEERGVVMEPGPDSQAWEGLQGVDSFFPYPAPGGGWLALYGSARSELRPIPYWRVGLAEAPALEGPWKRLPGNPSPIEPVDIENPIVEPLDGGAGGYLAVYDRVAALDGFGWSHSPDGRAWAPGSLLRIPALDQGWCRQVRTPLGLVDEGGGRYSLFYSGFETPPDWDAAFAGGGSNRCAIGFVEVSL